MDAEKAAEQLKVIRQLMERPIRYSTQSGVSAILAGCAALGGLAADFYFSQRYWNQPHTAMWVNMAVWAAVFVAAFAAATILTHLRERACGMPFWSAIKMRILRAILPPFVAGVGLTLAIVSRWYADVGPNQWGLVPAVWMLFYGLALWQVGEFGIREVRLLGAAFLAAGLVTAALFQYTVPGTEPGTAPYWTLGVTFGGFHLIYGAIVWVRHGG